MNGTFKFAGLTIALASFAACAGVNQLPEEGTKGANLLREKCTLCHGQPHPSRHTAQGWKHFVDIMEGHMKKKGIDFSSEDKKTILDYLQRNSSG